MKKVLGLIGLAVLPMAANAQQEASRGFSYTYVDVGYVDVENDVGSFDVDGDGLQLRGAVELTDLFYLTGDYTDLDHEGNIDSSMLSVGVGVRRSVQSNLDLIGEVTWVNAEVDTPFGDADEDGYGLALGLRYRANNDVELEGAIRHVDVEDSNTLLDLRGRYYLNPSLALTGGLLIDSGDLGWTVGIRANFGR
ncbi:MAG TPA: outer membrane beta-barrel protein [Gammaproteobacteria bacterium]